jgi:hypothetical protein
MGGRFPVEWVAGLAWNQWPDCRGIGGRFGVELVATLPWNTQPGVKTIWQGLQRIMDVATALQSLRDGLG